MAAPTDRVYVLKRETSARGGTDADEAEFPTIIDPYEDGLVAQGLFLQPPGGPEDENVYLTRDGSGNVVFRDANHGGTEYTLKQLAKEVASGSSDAQSNTTATSYQQKLKATATYVAGTYLILWYAEVSLGAGNKLLNMRVQIDDATTIAESSVRPAVSGYWESLSGFYRVALTAASHDIDIDWRSNAATYTSSIRNAKVQVMRVG